MRFTPFGVMFSFAASEKAMVPVLCGVAGNAFGAIINGY
jgi:hypothetical protein